jgi:ribonucleoside-diphosphate reductase alpha chain
MIRYAVGHGTLPARPASTMPSLKARGFTEGTLQKLEEASAAAFDIRFASTNGRWARSSARGLGFTSEQLNEPSFDMLPRLGFTKADIEVANTYCCGAMTLEGAPFLKAEHLPIFDCANPVRPHRQALTSRSRATSA